MEVDSAIYNEANTPQIESARDLIAQILVDHPQRDLDVILDVGCGTGNVTKILSDSIPHKNILALDSNSKMITQADLNNTNKTTDFITEDISKSWDNLDNKLQALEGSVDLIFSNFVLHWIAVGDRNVAFDNMFRLLKPNGWIYCNIAIIEQMSYLVCPEETKAIIKKYNIKIDSSEAQKSNWLNCFELNGFANLETKLHKVEWNFDTTEKFMKMLPLFRSFYIKHNPQLQQLDKKILEDVINKIDNAMIQLFSVKSEITPGDSLQTENYKVSFDNLVCKARAKAIRSIIN